MSNMLNFTPIHLPQSGPNDVTATIVEWTKPPGQWMRKGEMIGAAETTKSIFDLEAPAAGVFWPLAAVGAEAAVGSVIAALGAEGSTQSEAQAWLVEYSQSIARQSGNLADDEQKATPSVSRMWTIKAELLAQRHNINLAEVPAGGERITEGDVQAFLATRAAAGQAAGPAEALSAAQKTRDWENYGDLVDDRYPANRPQRLLIIGGGNGAVQILDVLAKTPHQRAVGILDDNSALHGKTVAGVPVLGAIDLSRVLEMSAAGHFDAAVISISTSIPARRRIFEQWKGSGLTFANVIHPSCVVGINVVLGEGNVIMAFCHLGACAGVGDNNFLSAYCSIEHHCRLGSHCSFGPAVVTSSRVQIDDGVRFGTGIYIEPGIHIGANSVIASGLAIAEHIPADSLLKAHIGYSIRAKAAS